MGTIRHWLSRLSTATRYEPLNHADLFAGLYFTDCFGYLVLVRSCALLMTDPSVPPSGNAPARPGMRSIPQTAKGIRHWACGRRLIRVNFPRGRSGVTIAFVPAEDEFMSSRKLPLPILIAVAGLIAMPQEQAQTGTGNVPLEASDLSGPQMYRTYCATCHGFDGKGSGPAAAALKKAPPDLTQIRKKNNGQFPDFRIMRIIDGYEIEAAHGSRDMPMWGDYFRSQQRDEGIISLRERNLTDYIRSIQQK